MNTLMQVLSVYTNAYASGGKAKVKSHATVLAWPNNGVSG